MSGHDNHLIRRDEVWNVCGCMTGGRGGGTITVQAKRAIFGGGQGGELNRDQNEKSENIQGCIRIGRGFKRA